MSLTLNEIKERLLRFDEVSLMEELGITSEDLIERFTDIIERDQGKFEELVEDPEKDEDNE